MERASIFWNDRKGRYYLSYADSDGRRRQVSTGSSTRAGAVACARTFDERLRIKSVITLSAFSAEFLSYASGVYAADTVRLHKLALDQFIAFAGDVQLRSVRTKTIEQFLSHTQSTISQWSARRHYGSLAAAFERAVAWEYLPINPWRKVKKPKAPEIDKPFLTSAQFQLVHAMIDDELVRDVAVMSFHTGMRIGEATSIGWSAVDLASRRIRIRNKPTFKTKNGKQRTVPMNDIVFSMLKRRKEALTNEEDRILAGKSDENISVHFKRAARAVFGTDTAINFHTLRHSFISNLLRGGANIRVVQMLAGHASIETTEKYCHTLPEDAVNAVNLLQ